MPIWLRKTTIKFIQDSIDQENEAQRKAAQGTKSGGSNTTNLDWANPDRSKMK